MTRLRLPRRRTLALAAVVAAFAGCVDGKAHYDPAQDDSAMAAIASAWAEAGGLSLSLCDDVTVSEKQPTDGCGTSHVVRGGELGATEAVSDPGGCGGCGFYALAHVRGVASGAGLAGDVPVVGTVRVGGSHGTDDPYGFPYELGLTCDDPNQPCTIYGELDASGRLDAHLTIGTAGHSVDHVLERIGAAACPAP